MGGVETYLFFLLLTVIVHNSLQSFPSSRIENGYPIDTIERFPWHVSIRFPGGLFRCSGTVVAKRWVLTSGTCVNNDVLYELSFQRLYLDSFDKSFSVVVDRTAVVDFPTGVDNLAMIKLPISLELSAHLNTANLTEVQIIDNSLVVMPGFSNSSNELSYGMFKLLPILNCKNIFGAGFNEYLELCTEAWAYTGQVPCQNNDGGGLVAGWPLNPVLVGIFTKSSNNCENDKPARYTNLGPYVAWINDVIKYM